MKNPLSNQELGRRIGAARGYSGLNHDKFAERFGKSPGTLRNYERGLIPADKRSWAVDTACEISGLPPEFFEIDFKALREAMISYPGLGLEQEPPVGPELTDEAAEEAERWRDSFDDGSQPPTAPPADAADAASDAAKNAAERSARRDDDEAAEPPAAGS